MADKEEMASVVTIQRENHDAYCTIWLDMADKIAQCIKGRAQSIDAHELGGLTKLANENEEVMKQIIAFLNSILGEIKKSKTYHYLYVDSEDAIRKYFAKAMSLIIITCAINREYRNEFLVKTSKCLDYVKQGLKFCVDKHNRNMALELNNLLVTWDKLLSTRHNGFVPNHCILLTEIPEEKKGINAYSIKMPNNIDEDTYLIMLCVSSSPNAKRTKLFCLHELGHYIGCRLRTDRPKLYYVLCILSFYECVYRKAWSEEHLLGMADTLPNRDSYKYYSSSLRRKMQASKKVLEKCALTTIKQALADDTLNNIRGFENTYLHTIHGRILAYLERNAKVYKGSIEAACKTTILSDTGMITILCKAVEQVLDEARSGEGEKGTDWHFIYKVDSILEEISADVFMISTLDLCKKDISIYLSCIVEETRTLYNKCSAEVKEQRPFWLVVLSDTLRMRITAILYILLNGNVWETNLINWFQLGCALPSKWNIYKRLAVQYNKFLSVDSIIDRKNEKDEGKKDLDLTNAIFLPQDTWNPTRLYSFYAATIYQDPVYKKIHDTSSVDKLKRFNWPAQAGSDETSEDYNTMIANIVSAVMSIRGIGK